MEAWLSRHGVPFTARNIEDDERAYDELLAFGVRRIPLTIVDGAAVTGFDEAALGHALAAARRRAGGL